jgi:hypothetical protein
LPSVNSQNKAALFIKSAACNSLRWKLLECFGDVTGADAASADFDASYCTLTDGLNFLQVRVPGATGFIVCMTYIIPEARAFATDFTDFGH